MKRRNALVVVAAALVCACATAPPVPRGAGASTFVIERDLAGPHLARGEFRAINGVRRPFSATLGGTWDGEALTLVEDFVFDDGERDRKTWRLEKLPDGAYRGVREDVVGFATGTQDGDVFRLDYKIRLPSKNGRGTTVRFRDVLALDDAGVVVNDAVVSKFGLRVGSVSLRIEPASQTP